MKSESRIAALVGPLQSRLRAYAFGPELDSLAQETLSLLAPYRRSRADLDQRNTLKAMALAAEYLDAHGRSQEAAALLRKTAEALLDGQLGEGDDLKLQRQRVWCCLAYGHTYLRANRNAEAGKVIERVREFVEDQLVRPEFPCHGTVALLRYYSGLWHRNSGRLDAAARDFDVALDQVRLRYEGKRAKYDGVDADRLRRELVYSRVMAARILGFGQGGIALAQGRNVEARGWMAAASMILANLGQEMWRRSLEVYERACVVQLAECSPASEDRLRLEAQKLQELEKWFTTRNPRNGYVAAAFGLLAEVRLRQIASGRMRRVELGGIDRKLDAMLRKRQADAGPLTETASWCLVECLLRSGQFERCEAELERKLNWSEESDAQRSLIEAELWMETGREARARAVLEELAAKRLAHRGNRARAWGLLAMVEKQAGQMVAAERSMSAAKEAAAAAQDGFSRALVEELALEVETREIRTLEMPYQRDEARWCDMDYNLEMARLNVVAAAHARHPEFNVEKLATLLGRGHSWLYALLARHREIDWVSRLLVQRKG
jgi:hypothetical protein